MDSPLQPDTPCPLALALSVFLILGCPLAPVPPSPEPRSNSAYCYFDPVPSRLHIASFRKMCLTFSFVGPGPNVHNLLSELIPLVRGVDRKLIKKIRKEKPMHLYGTTA